MVHLLPNRLLRVPITRRRFLSARNRVPSIARDEALENGRFARRSLPRDVDRDEEEPRRCSETEFLEVVGDPVDLFCETGQWSLPCRGGEMYQAS